MSLKFPKKNGFISLSVLPVLTCIAGVLCVFNASAERDFGNDGDVEYTQSSCCETDNSSPRLGLTFS